MDVKEQSESLDSIVLIEEGATAQERSDRLQWWHQIAAPPVPAISASRREREAHRRGKYISNTLLAMISIVIVVAIVVGGMIYRALLPNHLLTLLLLCVAVFFNRRGQVIVSGIIVVLTFDISLIAVILTFPNLTPFMLPYLDLLVIPELFAASLLPPRFVFFDMLIHIVFIISTLTFLMTKDTQLIAISHTSAFADAIMRPIVIQVITAIVAYTWMTSVTLSVRRAERATSFAVNVANQLQDEAEQKLQLTYEIRKIIEVQRQVASGIFEARVPLQRGNILWPMAGSLNNLLGRVQSLYKESQKHQRTDEALVRFFEARNRANNGPISWQPTGTSVDALVRQHNQFSKTLRL